MKYEQLTLFPTEEEPTDEEDIITEETEADELAFIEIAKTIGADFDKALTKRADMAAFNYLMRYGVPRNPSDVRFLLTQGPVVFLVWAVERGYITLTDKALATPEERAKNEERVNSVFEEVGDEEGVVLQGNFGQYL